MFGNILGSLFDKEKMVRETIQSALENVLEELNEKRNKEEVKNEYNHDNLFIMIKPFNAELDFKCYIYLVASGSAPKLVREISLNEILGGEEEG